VPLQLLDLIVRELDRSVVSALLGNNRTQALGSYIDPNVFEPWIISMQKCGIWKEPVVKNSVV
jgi:hypothetical protein